MSILNPTPPELLCDAQGRPYFLWDCDMTLEQFRGLLRSQDQGLRAHLVAKLMRQAKPDDVFTFVTLDEIRALWPRIRNDMGRNRDFWNWLLREWNVA